MSEFHPAGVRLGDDNRVTGVGCANCGADLNDHSRVGMKCPPHWISVNDRLPAPNEGVIVQLAGSFRDRCLAYVVHPERIEIDKPNVGIWRVLYVGPDWKVTREPDFHHTITHWQPMPPPAADPKEGTE